jgi:hypothetical protein
VPGAWRDVMHAVELEPVQKVALSDKAFEHQSNRADVHDRLAVLRYLFIVFTQTTATTEPGKRTLDNPATWLNGKTNLVFWLLNLLKCDCIVGFGILNDPVFVALVNPDELEVRKITTKVGKYPLGALAILDIGRVDQYAQHKASAVN